MLSKDSVFAYLGKKDNWVSNIDLASELNATIPNIRSRLEQLGSAVETDGDNNWRALITNQD